MSTAALWVASGCHLGESPRWDDRAGCLLWVDLEAGRLWRASDPAHVRVISLGRATGVATPREDGGLVTAGPGGVTWTDEDGTARHTVDLPEDWSRMRINDGACDPAGRLVVGSVPWEPGAHPGRLHQVDGTGAVRTLLDGIGMSNGIGWSPDGTRLHHVDTLAGVLTTYAYDVASGDLGAAQDRFTVDPAIGVPDGLVVDAEGALWVAVWGGGVVVRYTPAGTELDRIEVPARFVTSATAGGPDLRDLYLTTARWDLGADDLAREPDAGGVFHARLDVPGLPLHHFAGSLPG